MTEADILDHPRIAHGFFGRKGGCSTGIFASLNCGLGSGDDRRSVVRNRAVVAESLGRGEADIVTAFQVHSAEAMIITAPFAHDDRPKLDGLVTNVPGVVLGTLTADCCPVLFADPVAGVVGAAHAGWKGALTGITDATILKMEELGAARGNIRAALGPTISQRTYEVGPEFRERFPEEAMGYFTGSANDGRYMFDLPGYLSDRLLAFGVRDVFDTNLCTYTRDDEYFSYRRSVHAGEADYGRQIAAIVLK
jgi:polyphenol oxidase